VLARIEPGGWVMKGLVKYCGGKNVAMPRARVLREKKPIVSSQE